MAAEPPTDKQAEKEAKKKAAAEEKARKAEEKAKKAEEKKAKKAEEKAKKAEAKAEKAKKKEEEKLSKAEATQSKKDASPDIDGEQGDTSTSLRKIFGFGKSKKEKGDQASESPSHMITIDSNLEIIDDGGVDESGEETSEPEYGYNMFGFEKKKPRAEFRAEIAQLQAELADKEAELSNTKTELSKSKSQLQQTEGNLNNTSYKLTRLESWARKAPVY